MPKQSRLDAPGALHHVMDGVSRGLRPSTRKQRSLFPFVTYDAPVVKGKKLR